MTRRVIGQVSNGKYLSGKPEEAGNREHQLHRQHIRESMRESYSIDIIQPYKNGQPNTEFIQAYGKEDAINYFGEEKVIEVMEKL